MNADVPTIVVVDDAAEVRLLMKTRLRVSGMFQVVGEGADGTRPSSWPASTRPR